MHTTEASLAAVTIGTQIFHKGAKRPHVVCTLLSKWTWEVVTPSGARTVVNHDGRQWFFWCVRPGSFPRPISVDRVVHLDQAATAQA